MSESAPSRAGRDYGPVFAAVRARDCSTREAAMHAVVDAVWEHHGLPADAGRVLLEDAGGGEGGGGRRVSWVGFYEKVNGADEMVLRVRRDKPACSPIGLHGMCGRSYLERLAIVIDDIATLGGNYIACDPKDLSELVVPLFEPDGSCRGVLDLDSYETGAFDERDAEELRRLVELAGLSDARHASDRVLRL